MYAILFLVTEVFPFCFGLKSSIMAINWPGQDCMEHQKLLMQQVSFLNNTDICPIEKKGALSAGLSVA